MFDSSGIIVCYFFIRVRSLHLVTSMCFEIHSNNYHKQFIRTKPSRAERSCPVHKLDGPPCFLGNSVPYPLCVSSTRDATVCTRQTLKSRPTSLPTHQGMKYFTRVIFAVDFIPKCKVQSGWNLRANPVSVCGVSKKVS